MGSKVDFMIKKVIRTIYHIILHRIRNRERKKSYGNDYKDIIFYVIGVDYGVEGLFAIVKNVLVHIEYAILKGYIPVVDMENYKSQFQKKGINIWEFFFEQPMGYTLSDINKAKNVILSRNVRQWPGHSVFVSILNPENNKRLQSLKDLYAKYIVPSKKTSDYLALQYSQIIGNKQKIMGVLCRGTDYSNRPSGHPIQPNFEQIVQKLDMYEGKFDYVFVATEDENILQQFVEKYQEKALFVNQLRFSSLKEKYISDSGLKEDELIKLNLDYLSSIYILSRCDFFVGGRTAGTIGVSLLSTSQMKDFYAFDIGFYD